MLDVNPMRMERLFLLLVMFEQLPARWAYLPILPRTLMSLTPSPSHEKVPPRSGLLPSARAGETFAACCSAAASVVLAPVSNSKSTEYRSLEEAQNLVKGNVC